MEKRAPRGTLSPTGGRNEAATSITNPPGAKAAPRACKAPKETT